MRRMLSRSALQTCASCNLQHLHNILWGPSIKPCASHNSPMTLQERLDPIDWATYEPFVWAYEAALRPRTAVLYGLLTRLGLQGMQPVSRGAPPGEANVIAVAKQVLLGSCRHHITDSMACIPPHLGDDLRPTDCHIACSCPRNAG